MESRSKLSCFRHFSTNLSLISFLVTVVLLDSVATRQFCIGNETSPGAVLFGGHCYHAFPDILPQNESQDLCYGEGGYLVELNSVEEVMFLNSSTDALPILNLPADPAYWTGISRAPEVNSSWKLNTTDSDASYFLWAAVEPDNTFGNEYCVYMYSIGAERVRFVDYPCASRDYVRPLCEYNEPVMNLCAIFPCQFDYPIDCINAFPNRTWSCGELSNCQNGSSVTVISDLVITRNITVASVSSDNSTLFFNENTESRVIGSLNASNSEISLSSGTSLFITGNLRLVDSNLTVTPTSEIDVRGCLETSSSNLTLWADKYSSEWMNVTIAKNSDLTCSTPTFNQITVTDPHNDCLDFQTSSIYVNSSLIVSFRLRDGDLCDGSLLGVSFALSFALFTFVL